MPVREIENAAQERADTQAFLQTLRGLPQNEVPEAQDLFDFAQEIFVARAPGRLDVMGGIADYSGSLVLQWPIREATFVALQRAADREIRIVSLGAESNHRAAAFSMPLDELEPDGAPAEYAAARRRFSQDPAGHWAAYVAGALLVLMRELGVRFPSGVRILIASGVPEGKGVSSSAAIEVAAMQALAAAFGLSLDARETAIRCQQVENLVVGAPCGVMDQMASSCGHENAFLSLLCQPAELQGTVALPESLSVWGVDSGVRHSVSGADYGSVRAAAFMGYQILTALRGDKDLSDWGGYLANIAPSEFESRFAAHLPETISGSDFLAYYGGVIDPLSEIAPDRLYHVRAATAHPIYENHRVQVFSELMQKDTGARTAALLGELMYQSHASYSACGLGSDGTDRLVALVRQAGTASGLSGAKITGGGSGGTVAVLGRRGAERAVQAIAERYADETGRQPYLFTGSSPGAGAFGVLRLRVR